MLLKSWRNLSFLLILSLLYALLSLSIGCGDDDDDSDQTDDDNQNDDDAADDDAQADDDATDDDSTPAGRYGLPGWNILSGEYLDDGPLDGISFEWDYHMVHDIDGQFTGSIGYLVANPRQRDTFIGTLVPPGGNMAIAGETSTGLRQAEYKNFGYDTLEVSADIRSYSAEDNATGEYGRIIPDAEANTMTLQGRTASFEWDLEVAQDWPELTSQPDVFAAARGDDVGKIAPGQEHWNVDMLWPLTKITGTITDLINDEQFDIDARGYRENSWGRWAFNLGGWDFLVVSDLSARVMWAFQTYHFESIVLDYLDVGFYNDDELVLTTFRASDGELGWRHDEWAFDPIARQCVPRDTTVIAQNDRYRIEAIADIGDHHVAMLSDATIATRNYVINILMPQISGTIVDRESGAVVGEFSGQGGGEFSVYRSQQDEISDEDCAEWGMQFFAPDPQ